MSQYVKEDDVANVAFKMGAEAEREKIVGWIKSKSHHAGSRENELAEAIAEGEHLK